MVLDIYYPASLSSKSNDLYVVPFSTGFKVYRDPRVASKGSKYPLILVSHGRSGNRLNLAWFATFLASHGYIVASMLPVDASPALNVHDKRIKAAFAMAPGVMQGFGFDEKGLRELRIPTYLIVGEGDTITPIKENAGFVVKHAPNAKLRIIPGRVGHEIFLNECDEEGKAEFPEACVDDPSVNRAKVHKSIAGYALGFFDTHLKGL